MRNRLFAIIMIIFSPLNLLFLSAQEENKVMYIHSKGGNLDVIFYSQVDSIVYSKMDTDSVMHEVVCTQEIWSGDSVLRIPLSQIDSISFQTPSTIYKKDAVILTSEYQYWISRCDSLTLFFRKDTPSGLLPQTGDKLVTTDMNDLFPIGFIGMVKNIHQNEDEFVVECSQIQYTDVFDRYYCVVEGQCEPTKDGKLKIRKERTSFSAPLEPLQFNDQLEFTTGWKTSEYCELGGGISIDYSFEIQPTLRYVYANEYGDQFVSIRFDFDETFTTSNNLFGYFKAEKEVDVAKASIPVEAVPFTKFYLKAGPRIEFNGNLALSFSRSDQFRTTYMFTKGTNKNINYKNGFTGFKHTTVDQDVTMAVGSLSLFDGVFIEVGYGLLIEDWGKIYARFDAGLELTLEADLGKSVDDAAFSTSLYDRADDLVTFGLNVAYGPSVGMSMDVGSIHSGVNRGFMTRISLFEKGMFPVFEKTKFTKDSGNDGHVSFSTGGDMLVSVPIGFRVLDEDKKEIACEWSNNNFIGPFFQNFTFPFSIPKVNKKYTAYPLFKFLNKYEILASPSVEIGINALPITSDNEIISSNEVVVHGKIDSESFSVMKNCEVGFWVGTSSKLENMQKYSCALGVDRTFKLSVDGLESDTKYYYAAYLKDDDEYYYGEVKSFTTPEVPDDAVDLGLSVLWAKRNVGASSESDFGGLYGWADPSGENTSYDVMGDDGYTWVSSLYGGPSPVTNISGTSYDIATMKWGGKWRMPTQQEMVELIDNCQWTPTYQNGVPGMLVTADSGNSIFLPAAGDRFGTSRRDTGQRGYYWTSTLNTEQRRNAYRLDFGLQADDYDWNSYARYIGICVRPVMDKTN